MHTFEITVQRKSGDSWPVVVEEGQPGVFLPIRSGGTLHLDQVELTGQATPLAYGTVLGKALFRDAVRDAFIHARADSEDDLRVLLFVEDDELKELRWERLCAPFDNRWDFLTLDQRVFFSLYLPSLTDRRFPPIGRRDLRALILVANPIGLKEYGLDSFDDEATVANVRTALGEISADVLATVEGAAGPPTLDRLCEQITAEPYTLLHIVGHGQFRRGDGETILYLAGTDNQVEPVSTTRLLERLGRLRGPGSLPHLTFLCTCESAKAEAEGALGGLAQRLVRELGMPAVVAMTDTVSMATTQALAAGFYRQLRSHGEVDRALAEACAGLAERYDITVPALYSRLGGRPLFSDTLDRTLTNREIEFGLSCLEELVTERAPILQPDFESHAAQLQGTLRAEFAALSRTVRAERQAALIKLNGLCEEVVDLSFNALALGQEPPPYDQRVPFRGLYVFRSEDREFFFGREALVERLLGQWGEHNFLAVLGPSGSGKSSLVLAGLIPALQAQTPALQLAYLTPGSEPLARLQASLVRISNLPAVLVVDQFEELFTLCPGEAGRQAFLSLLLKLVRRIRVVLTMRADFWGECAPYRQLKAAMQARQELIAPLDAAELRRAMEQQAAAVGLRFEADLSHTILADVRGEPGAMPLLQHTLLELWQRRHGRWLRVKEYRAIGGVQQAIARTADSFYEELSGDEQDRARDIFVRLTRLDEEAVQGEERRDTRRRVGAEELVPVGSDPAVTRRLVQRMADARLVVTSVDDASGREEVEVVHEALIRYWPRLQDWLAEDRTSLHLREGLRQAAQEWEKQQRDNSYLMHRGGRLEEVEALYRQGKFTLNQLEQSYLEACVARREARQAKKEQQRRRELEAARRLAKAEAGRRQEAEARAQEQTQAANKLRRRAFYLAVALFLAILAIVSTLFFFNQAQNSAAEARQAADVSRSRELAASAIANLEVDPERSILLAMEAITPTYTREAEDALRRAIQASRVEHTLTGHVGAVRSVAYSPSATHLATAGDDGTVRIWDTVSGQTVLTWTAHLSPIYSIAFNQDGTRLASASSDRTAKVWDVGSGQLMVTLTGHTGFINGVAFSPDGTRLATASDDTTAKVWNISAGSDPDLLTLAGHAGAIFDVAFSPDGRRLATVSDDTNTFIWDAITGERLQTLSGHTHWVYGVAYSPCLDREVSTAGCDTYLATAGRDKTVKIWESTSAKLLQTLNDPSTVYKLAFSPDGKHLASSSADRTAKVWDVDTGEMKLSLAGHTEPVYGVAFSLSDGAGHLATASSDGDVKIWNVAETWEGFAAHSKWVDKVVFSPDGTYLVTTSLDGTARVWDTASHQLVTTLAEHSDYVIGAAFNPDGSRLATTSFDGTIKVWDTKSWTDLRTLTVGVELGAVAYSPDGSRLAATSFDGKARVWDTLFWQQVLTLSGHILPVFSVAFSPDGNLLATGSQDETVRLWEAASGRPIRILQPQAGPVFSLAFNPTFKTQLVTASGDGRTTAKVWDITSGELLYTLKGHTAQVNSLIFNQDGTVLATASSDKTVKVWDVAAGADQTPLTLPEHVDQVASVTFSPDQKYLAVSLGDGTVQFHILRVDDLLMAAQQRLTRPWRSEECQPYLHQEECPMIP